MCIIYYSRKKTVGRKYRLGGIFLFLKSDEMGVAMRGTRYRGRSPEGEQEGGDRGDWGRAGRRQGTPSYLKLLSVVRENNMWVISPRKLLEGREKDVYALPILGSVAGVWSLTLTRGRWARGKQKFISMCFKHVRGSTCLSNRERKKKRKRLNKRTSHF